MKLSRRLLSVLLALIMVACCMPIQSSAVSYSVGDIVTFGSYPRSRVTDSSLITSLNGVSLSWKSAPLYTKNNGADKLTYPSKSDSSTMKFADFTYGGNKYRAIKLISYLGKSTDSESSADYAPQSLNKYALNTVYYFKYEPIQWIVVNTAGTLITKDIIDSQCFNGIYKFESNTYLSTKGFSKYASDFGYATIRDWLNATSTNYSDYTSFNFKATAFSSAEQAIMSKVTCDNTPADSTLSIYNTQDYVYLISESEFNANKSVIGGATCTDYAAIQGQRGYYWYTRTAIKPNSVKYVAGTSVAYSNTEYSKVLSNMCGIRPMIKIDLGSSLVKKYAAPAYTLTYNANGGSGAPSQQTGAVNYTISSVKPTRSGYTFLGWSQSSSATSATYKSGDSITVSANTTLYAVWQKNAGVSDYTVSFYNSMGTSPASQTVKSGGKVTKPADPTATGFTFGGWYKEIACTNKWNFETDTVSSNTTLYAKWTIAALMPTAFAMIHTPVDTAVDYSTKVRVVATADNVPEGYYLAIYNGSKQLAKGSNTLVEYNNGKTKSSTTFTVKVVDADNNVQGDYYGEKLEKDFTVTVNNASFFTKIIAFFKGLFGALPEITIEP